MYDIPDLVVARRRPIRKSRQVDPSNLYVEFEGVEMPVIPAVAYTGIPPLVSRKQVNSGDDFFVLSDSSSINRIFYALRNGAQDRYYKHLAEQQPLVRRGKVTLDTMQAALTGFHADLIVYSNVWAELVDF